MLLFCCLVLQQGSSSPQAPYKRSLGLKALTEACLFSPEPWEVNDMPTTCQWRTRPPPHPPPACPPPHTHTHQHTCTEGFCGCSAPAQTPLKLSSPGNSISNRAHFLVVSGYGSTPPLPPTPPLHPLFLPSSMKLSPFTPRQSDPIWCV